MTAHMQRYNFTFQPSHSTEIPSLVLDIAGGTLAEAQALCKTYDCKIILTDPAGFPRGWVKASDYRLD